MMQHAGARARAWQQFGICVFIVLYSKLEVVFKMVVSYNRMKPTTYYVPTLLDSYNK